MKKRKLWISLGVLVLVVLATGVGLVEVSVINALRDGTQIEADAEEEEFTTDSDTSGEGGETSEEASNEEGTEVSEESSLTGGTMASNGVLPSKGSKTPIGSPTPNTDPNTIKVESSDAVAEAVSLPYTDGSSGLVVQSVKAYSGLYLEGGEDSAVDNVAVAVVKNPTSKDIEYAEITLSAGKKSYSFKGSVIPAGSQIVLQEADEKSFENASWERCEVVASDAQKLEMSEKQISCKEEKDGSLTVTNISTKDIPCVRVFYKFYMADEKAYLGGITYNAKITNLKAGSAISVEPSHYSAGYSKVVMIRTYNSDSE